MCSLLPTGIGPCNGIYVYMYIYIYIYIYMFVQSPSYIHIYVCPIPIHTCPFLVEGDPELLSCLSCGLRASI